MSKNVYDLFVRASETAFLADVMTNVNEFNFYQQCTFIVFILQCQILQHTNLSYSTIKIQLSLLVLDIIIIIIFSNVTCSCRDIVEK